MCQDPKLFWKNVEAKLKEADVQLTAMLREIIEDPSGCHNAKTVAAMILRKPVEEFSEAYMGVVESNKEALSVIDKIEKANEN